MKVLLKSARITDVESPHNNTSKDILFWNVGTEPKLEDESIYDRIDSFRNWKKIQT